MNIVIRPWKLYLDLIPHKYFHRGHWLAVNEPSPWYYFFPANRSFNIPTDRAFYQTLDEGLVGIVRHLHARGVPTTPSCTGHFSDASYYDQVYDRLIKQANQIMREGLLLHNPETKKDYYYRNIHHKLPWDRDTFINSSLDYQVKGVLGLIDNSKSIYKKLQPLCNVDHDGGVTLIYENSNNPIQKEKEWDRISTLLTEVTN